jgi:hypothetical protein
MRRWLPAAAAALVVVVAALAWFLPFVARSRQFVSSTGASPPFSNVTPVRLKPRSVLCMTKVTIDTDAGLAQFTAIPGSRPAPTLGVSAEGPGGYRSSETTVPGGYRVPGAQKAPITPPPHPLIGRVCVRNAGRTAISFVGTTEERTSGREQTVIDGRRVEPDVQLNLLERDTRTLLEGLPDVLRHMAAFKGSFVSVGLLWVLLLLVTLGVPALVLGAIAAATGQRSRSAGGPEPDQVA